MKCILISIYIFPGLHIHVEPTEGFSYLLCQQGIVYRRYKQYVPTTPS